MVCLYFAMTCRHLDELCRMAFGITETAHSCRQLNRVKVDPRRRAVRLWYQHDIQSIFRFAIVEVYVSQFLFLFDVLLAINLGMSRKRLLSRWRARPCHLEPRGWLISRSRGVFRSRRSPNVGYWRNVSGARSMVRNRVLCRRSIVCPGRLKLLCVKLLHCSREI